MKQPRRVLGNLLAMVLTLFSLHALAETQTAGNNFDHSNTGFPLTGVHATTACETCHVAGVFKGTAKTCDGCHALGKRIVATPKSTSHIVTDAPCDSCHFNSFTFVGARFNHGSALPGQCVTCHNNRITQGRPANHNAGFMLTASCDSCHRTYAFLPASWNHTGVAMGGHTCNQAGCHVSGTNNRYTAATATSPVSHSYPDTSIKSCDACHLSFVSWNATMHEPLTGTCLSCHLNGALAQGQPADHSSFNGWPTDCSQCHTSTTSWLGALGAMPVGHVTFTAGTPCSACHTGSTVATGPTLHAYLSQTACNSCHYRGAVVYAPNHPPQQSSHAGNTTCSASGCHRPLGSKGTAYISWN